MSHRFPSILLAVFLLLPTGDFTLAANQIADGSKSLVGSQTTTVRLVSRSGQSFAATVDSLRTRFCREGNTDPCYDYAIVYVHLDNCGVTAYPLSEITYFETMGEFQPSSCIPATQAATLSTEREVARKVYLQDLHLSLVGTEISTGETVVLPLGELSYLRR